MAAPLAAEPSVGLDEDLSQIMHRQSDVSSAMKLAEQLKLKEEEEAKKNETPFQKAQRELQSKKIMKEVMQGKRIGFYRLKQDLGSGSFAQVKLGVHVLTAEKVAVKIIDKSKLDEKHEQLLQREIAMMEKVHHPNILRIYEVIETHHRLFIIMEYAPGGEMFNYVLQHGRYTEEEAKKHFGPVIAGIEHCHEKKIVHRDIKAQNILFDIYGNVKVADFGFSTMAQDNKLNTFCGSPPYAAPELFKEEIYAGEPVDVWALGILLYFMVTGNMPFEADTVTKLRQKVLEGKFTCPSYVSANCKDLIEKLLILDPAQRYTIAQIKAHPWMAGVYYPPPDPPRIYTHDQPPVEEDPEMREMLDTIGITGSKLNLAVQSSDTRNNMVGTVRLVKHKIERRRSSRKMQEEQQQNIAQNSKSAQKAAKPNQTQAVKASGGCGCFGGMKKTNKVGVA
eukprot:Colp12_sorted_trinity150504_noHs@30093